MSSHYGGDSRGYDSSSRRDYGGGVAYGGGGGYSGGGYSGGGFSSGLGTQLGNIDFSKTELVTFEKDFYRTSGCDKASRRRS